MKKPTNPFWKPGEQAALARAAGVEPSNLSLVLHRKRGVSWPVAGSLEDATEIVLGKKRQIIAEVWMDSRITRHPAFSGKPLKIKTK